MNRGFSSRSRPSAHRITAGSGCHTGSSRSAPRPAARRPECAHRGRTPGPDWRRRCARPCPSATGAG
ncbi:hypothetical protein ACFFX0_18265 [Citricoccus parietis]|uniref:Uncharacterized protein n=1 Tax=Citricoccus parietis TaxID=592307 RepID=A0ABV5G281_9MICC